MQIRDLMVQIAASYPPYREKVRVDKAHPVYAMVEREFPEALNPYISKFDTLFSEGSTGAGFDRRLTTSATTGYYVVYLFSTDLTTVTLTLAFGTTQFEKQFGNGIAAFPHMRSAATRLQEMFNHLMPASMFRGSITLGATPRQKLHYAYEQSAILSYAPYRISELPNETQIVSDLVQLAGVYTDIVSDPLEATIERLVEAVVEPAGHVTKIEVRDFQPRIVAPKQKATGEATGNRVCRRYSPESRKVGLAGEKVVFEYECQRLRKAGREDLSAKVRWHAREQEFPGWDITSYENDGSEIFIEVKSSAGKLVSSVDLTANEWEAACDSTRRKRYYIYIVTEALSAIPHIERLSNPVSYVAEHTLSCKPIVYELRLSQTDYTSSELVMQTGSS